MVFSIVLKGLKQEQIWELPRCPQGSVRKDQEADRYENSNRPKCPYPVQGTFSVFPIFIPFALPALFYSQHAKKKFLSRKDIESAPEMARNRKKAFRAK
jgi:hypothetical protein